MKLGCEETEKLSQNYWRLNNLYTLYPIYQEMNDEISYLVGILQEVADLENYRNKLEEVIKKYERDHRISM